MPIAMFEEEPVGLVATPPPCVVEEGHRATSMPLSRRVRRDCLRYFTSSRQNELAIADLAAVPEPEEVQASADRVEPRTVDVVGDRLPACRSLSVEQLRDPAPGDVIHHDLRLAG